MSSAAELDQDIAALRAKAAEYGARHSVIEQVTWPEGVRVAVNFTADFDAMLLRRVLEEPPMQLAKGEFGGRVGIWRLIELFDSHAIKATIFTPGRICELYPEAVKAASRSGHEIADHMWEHRVPSEPELERDHLRKAKAAIERLTGKKPVGTRSWHTQALLLEEGFIYNSHDTADHRPHYVSKPDGSGPLLNLPFHYVIDDAMFFSFAWLSSENAAQRMMDPDHVEAIWWDAFMREYRQGGYLNVCMHPFVSGRALRIAMLDRLITRMKALPGVWFPTVEQVARHVLKTHPPSSLSPLAGRGSG
ncbi:MAG: chitin deacetylase [Gammaproteobacteria bacterium]|nr:chitin deacetylase [Gammaproteobacteria bacterium]